jgi:hypothetical protein
MVIMCLHGEVAMLGSDGMDSRTRVPAAKCAWTRVGACGYVLSFLVVNGLAT